MSKATPGAPAARLGWLDCCKGICIVLVVYGHVTGGLTLSGVVATDSIFEWMRSWVYLFHMPAFFFLSGLLAARVLGRPWSTVLSARTRTLVYPYILWTGIYLIVQAAMSRYVNSPADFARASHFLWEPYGYGLWFLYSLFLISPLFHLLAHRNLYRGATLLAAFLLYVAAEFNVFGFWPILNTAMLNFIFYAVGGLYSGTIQAWLSRGRSYQWWIGGLFLLTLMTLVALMFKGRFFVTGLLAAWLGIGGVVFLARAMAEGALGIFFGLLGFYSLEIYLGHPLFSTAARAILSRFGFHNPVASIIFGVALGVFVSLVLAMLCRRYQFPYLFRWPVEVPQDRRRNKQS